MPLSVTDIGTKLEFFITEDGAPADLSAATILLYVKNNINSPFTLTAGTEQGVAEYIVQAGDFTVGVELAVIVVEINATNQFRAVPFLFEVEPLFGWGM